MDREHFLWELRIRLEGRIPEDRLEAVMAYYNAYFDDAGPEREQEVLNGLGTPAQVARQILGETTLKKLERREGGGLGMLFRVLLAIFAAPIALPLALLMAVLAAGLVFCVAACVVLVGVGGILFVVTGGVIAVAGFSVVLTNWATSVYFLGGGLVLAGVGFLLVVATLALGRWCIRGFTGLAGRVLRRKEVSG